MSTEDKFLKLAYDRFDESEAAYSEWRKLATADLQFCANDQWDIGVRQAREQAGKPCLTADHISPAIRQIVNESRQNRPSIEVNAKSDGADEDTAKIISGAIRDIEYQSNADAAYDTAEEYAVKCGMGFYRLVPEYEDCNTFDQVLRIKGIDDPLTVYFDPNHREPDGSDAEYCFITKNYTEAAYRREFNKTKLAGYPSWKGKEYRNASWFSADSVTVAEYYCKEYKPKTIYHVATFVPNAAGELQFFDEQVLTEKPSDEDLEAQRVQILNTRESQEVQVKHYILNGKEKISETDFPGEYIPVFIVKGEDFWVNGKRAIMGAVRRAMDTQRIINYAVSNQVEAIDNSNRAPYIGAAGQFDTFEQDWKTAHQKNLAYLQYNAMDIAGQQVPPPARNSYEAAIQAIAGTRATSVSDIDRIFGIYEAARGERSNETSGVAIVARKEQSSNSNFAYYDNLVRSIKHLGRVLVNCIPTYYDTARTIRIVKPSGDQELVAINQYIQERQKTYDFSAGKYSVVVKTGPTYQTKRAQLVESGTALIAQYPAAGPLIADLLVSASDFEGNQEIAARLRTQVPPEVLSATGEDGEIAGDPKQALAGLQQKLQQAQKNTEALNAHASDVEQQLQDAQRELQLEKESKQIELIKAQLDYNLKAQELTLREATNELEFLLGQQKNQISNRQLDIQEKGTAIKALDVASNVADKLHDKESKYLENSRDKTIATISDIKPLPAVKINGEAMDNNLQGPEFG